MPQRKSYDVVVIGAGGAGSAAAEQARACGAKVLLVSKDPIVCSDSKISEGIVTVRGSGSHQDSVTELASNLRIQGDDLAEPLLTQAFAGDSRDSYGWLQKYGLLPAETRADGTPRPLGIPMGGHTLPRSIVHRNGGLDYGHACWNAVVAGAIDYLEDAWFLDLYTRRDEGGGGSGVCGGLIYHAAEGAFVSVRAKAVVIACGGLGTLYFPNTDTMKGNTGDSYALALRAGAQLVDMEQVQFIPFAVTHPPAYQGLVIGEPILAGILGVIRDKDGKPLQAEIMGRTRAECAAVIARAVAEGRGTANGGCWLDLTGNGRGRAGAIYAAMMQDKARGILEIVRGAYGPRAARFEEPWEVRPSAHYLMGGVRAGPQCEVLDRQDRPIAGLFVAGQALGGLHGSNRLGSTSLAEGISFGRRGGRAAAAFAAANTALDWQVVEAREAALLQDYRRWIGRDGGETPIGLLRELQAASWKGIGPARTQAGLETVLQQISSYARRLQQASVAADLLWNQTLIDLIECRNLLLCAEAIARSALARPYSLGAHVRLDQARRTGRHHYSAACHLQDGALVVSELPRQRSPRSARWRLRLRQSLKIALFRTLRSLPEGLRDALLFRIYSKALGVPPAPADEAAADASALGEGQP